MRQREERSETRQQEVEKLSVKQFNPCLKKQQKNSVLNAKLLTETEEECVHTHGEHAEETMGDEVGSHHQGLSGDHRQVKAKTFTCDVLRNKSH